MPEHDRAHDRLAVIGVLVLHEHGHPLVLIQAHFPFVRFDLAR